MGLLDKLWDETVAGPQPQTGLSKLRRSHTLSSSLPSSPFSVSINGGSPPVTRSITILRNCSSLRVDGAVDAACSPRSPNNPLSFPSSPSNVSPASTLATVSRRTVKNKWAPKGSEQAVGDFKGLTARDWAIMSSWDT